VDDPITDERGARANITNVNGRTADQRVRTDGSPLTGLRGRSLRPLPTLLLPGRLLSGRQVLGLLAQLLVLGSRFLGLLA
jgi:hypothetical protein